MISAQDNLLIYLIAAQKLFCEERHRVTHIETVKLSTEEIALAAVRATKAFIDIDEGCPAYRRPAHVTDETDLTIRSVLNFASNLRTIGDLASVCTGTGHCCSDITRAVQFITKTLMNSRWGSAMGAIFGFEDGTYFKEINSRRIIATKDFNEAATLYNRGDIITVRNLLKSANCTDFFEMQITTNNTGLFVRGVNHKVADEATAKLLEKWCAPAEKMQIAPMRLFSTSGC